MVICYDYALGKRIAQRLAEVFSMRFFDQLELFEFDHIPRTFEEVYKMEGRDYVLKKFRSIIKMELDFDNAAFTAHISLADNSEELFYRMKLSNFVILLYKPIEKEMLELENKMYKSPEQKEFAFLQKDVLQNYEEKIKKDCADIAVNIDGISEDALIELIEKLIEAYYTTK